MYVHVGAQINTFKMLGKGAKGRWYTERAVRVFQLEGGVTDTIRRAREILLMVGDVQETDSTLLRGDLLKEAVALFRVMYDGWFDFNREHRIVPKEFMKMLMWEPRILYDSTY